MDLQGRTALVTGASGGLGQAIARGLHERGAELVVSGRRAQVLEALASEISGRAVVADLEDRTDVEHLLAEAGEVDVLVANAGLPADGKVLEYTPEQIDRGIDVNLRAPIHLARALAEPMVERAQGHIVFLSSVAGKVATSHQALYAATKFGLRGFSSGLRQDLRGTGVGVSCVFPTVIREAGMFADSGAEMPWIARTRSPEQVARAVVKAIEHDRAEVDVADLATRLWAKAGSVAPEALSRLNRRLGGDEVAARITGSEAHRSKR